MTEIDEFELRRALEPYVYDGTESLLAISALVNACSQHSHPQALLAAIGKILTHQYAGSVPIDAIVDYYAGVTGENPRHRSWHSR